jgi:hypothetical protein
VLNSPNIPEVTYSPDINDLFHYFGVNWDTLSPALWLLYGVLFAFAVLAILKHFYSGD